MSMSTYRIRASSWASLFDCAYKWEGVHLLGMRNPVGFRATLGTAIHAGTAAYDKARVEGETITADDAASIMVDALHHPKDDVDYSADDLTVKDAELIGLKLLALYCTRVSPQHDYIGIELETKPLDIYCGSGIVVTLTGTLDRARIRKIPYQDGVGIVDLKTGKTAVQKGVAKTKGHAAQIGTYELLYEHTTGIRPDQDAEIIGLKTSGTPEIALGSIKNARELMVGDNDSPGLIEFAADMFRTGRFYPNPSSMLCSPKYCARYAQCKYHRD